MPVDGELFCLISRHQLDERDTWGALAETYFQTQRQNNDTSV